MGVVRLTPCVPLKASARPLHAFDKVTWHDHTLLLYHDNNATTLPCYSAARKRCFSLMAHGMVAAPLEVHLALKSRPHGMQCCIVGLLF